MAVDVLVIAPHPDDETLGCGGTLLAHAKKGDRLHWLIVTALTGASGFSEDRICRRADEIASVSSCYPFHSVHSLEFPTTLLDTIPSADLVKSIGKVVSEVSPQVIYLPFSGDIHTDHKIVFDASAACTKWFRYSSIKRVLAYEVMSETDFSLAQETNGFHPNVFVDISPYLDAKIEIMRIYSEEMGDFPFPRSEEGLRALAMVRGSAAGCSAAEGFLLLKEIVGCQDHL